MFRKIIRLNYFIDDARIISDYLKLPVQREVIFLIPLKRNSTKINQLDCLSII